MVILSSILQNHKCETQQEPVVDERLQLVNNCDHGPVEHVSVPNDAITSLHGILLDFDPSRLHPDVLIGVDIENPIELYTAVVKPWLERHPVFSKSQVVASGSGLHVILRLSTPVTFTTPAERQSWSAIVKVVQRVLPSDPDCPGITAMTRPLGSINSKNGKQVSLIAMGEPVAPEEIRSIVDEMTVRPFATIASILFRDGRRLSPCPCCGKEGSRLDILDRYGKCYGICGDVTIANLFDQFMAPRPSKKGGR